MLTAGGPTPDSIINAGTALLVAIVAGGTSLIVAFFQSRAHKADQRNAAEEWQSQAEELRDRMARNYEREISYLKDELRREQRRKRTAHREGADEH